MESTIVYVEFLAPCAPYAYMVGECAFVHKDKIAPWVAMGKARIIPEPVVEFVGPPRNAQIEFAKRGRPRR